jgi:3-phenylpropionate/cinnamic acid dioxygenase small subunit
MDVEDRIAITDMLARYAHTYDAGDWDGLKQVFTHDAEYEILGQVGKMPSVMRGADEIVAAFRARREEIQPAQRRHLSTNLAIDANGHPDSAIATSYLLLASTREGHFEVLAAGRYDDVLQKGTDGQWRIKRRTVAIDTNVA